MADETLVIPQISPGIDPQFLAIMRDLVTQVEALATASEHSATASEHQESGVVRLNAAYSLARGILGDVREGYARLSEMASHVAELATQQENLDAYSRRLGVSFDDAANAAGRFTTAQDTMAQSATFAREGVRLTQDELNALAAVAGSGARPGESVRDAMDALTQALQRGSEMGLRRFGLEAQDASHHGLTLQGRLDELVQHSHDVTRATDTASDSMARFSERIEDAKRVAADAFVNEIRRLQLFGTEASNDRAAVEDLSNDMRALGQTAAYVVGLVGNVAGVVIGSIATGISMIGAGLSAAAAAMGQMESTGSVRGMGAAFMASWHQSTQSGALGDVAEWTRNRMAGLSAVANDNGGAGGSQGGAPSLPPSASEAAADQAMRATRGGGAGGGGETPAQAAQKWLHTFEAYITDHPDDTRDVFHGHLTEAAVEDIRRHFGPTQAQAIVDHLTRSISERYTQELDRIRQQTDTWLAGETARLTREASATEAAKQSIGDRDIDAANDRAAEQRAKAAAQVQARAQRDPLGRISENLSQYADTSKMAADTVVNSFNSMTDAAATHFNALVTGKETAGEAMKGILHDVTAARAKEAATKAVVELAEGFAALASDRYDAAPAAFTASAVYGDVAVSAGALSAATAPSAAASSGHAASSGAGSRASLPPPSNDNGRAGGGVTIVYQFGGAGSHFIGGSQASRAQVGHSLMRDFINPAAIQRHATITGQAVGQ